MGAEGCCPETSANIPGRDEVFSETERVEEGWQPRTIRDYTGGVGYV